MGFGRRKFDCRHHVLINCYNNHTSVLSSFITCHRICNKNNMRGATSEAGTAHPSGSPEFIPGL